jgi:phytoene dehydrogenase-like protein
MLLYGAPGIVEGGCAALTRELERRLSEQGAELRLRHDVVQILAVDGSVKGVRVRDKASGAECVLSAPLVVSDIGPRATNALLNNQQVKQADVLKKHAGDVAQPGDTQEAIGLKVHILSDVSLIPHKGIMYCLDTRRIAGMVQPTNCDPRLAPAGKHLLISHQVIQSDNIEEEKALALADLRMMFGETFEQHCRVLTTGAYRGEWPVNRLAQGEDVPVATAVQGLYLVGDAVKPTGYLMVEGVAQSVNQFLDLFDAIERGKVKGPLDMPHLARQRTFWRSQDKLSSRRSRLNVLRWLWEAPGNSRHA